MPLFTASQGKSNVSCVDLYAEYPDFRIDIDREQQRLTEHDVVIFMFPLYWYSTPSLLKEWQDLVFEYGFAYGRQGTALHGKTLLCAVTAGGAEEAYQTDGYNHFTLRELLRPIEQTALLTGMHYLPPFALFSARTAPEENRLANHITLWHQTLEILSQQSIDTDPLEQTNTLNEALPHLRGLSQ